ncbi:MAG: protein phosphatase 2C domain-containing protein [Actinobacteria bacterium]|nr:protein phosphatase 2C domain-containing protein [Actinomycetota bacterium]
MTAARPCPPRPPRRRPAEAAQPAAATRPVERACPSCGHAGELRDSFCEACGVRLEPVAATDGQAPVGRDHQELDLGLVAGISDRGRRHPRNEDALALATVETGGGPVVIAVLCDGISSADRPDEASLAAAQAAAAHLAAAVPAGVSTSGASVQAVQVARAAVRALARPGEEEPAATYLSAVLTRGTVTLCWLGDSRGYWLDRWPQPGGQQLTQDDSLAAELVAAGELAAADVLTAPEAHVVTRWIGADDDEEEPHVAQFAPPGPGVLLLCSDGLWNYAPEPERLSALAMPAALTDPAGAATALVQFALDAGGMDNITVALAPFPPV